MTLLSFPKQPPSRPIAIAKPRSDRVPPHRRTCRAQGPTSVNRLPARPAHLHGAPLAPLEPRPRASAARVAIAGHKHGPTTPHRRRTGSSCSRRHVHPPTHTSHPAAPMPSPHARTHALLEKQERRPGVRAPRRHDHFRPLGLVLTPRPGRSFSVQSANSPERSPLSLRASRAAFFQVTAGSRAGRRFLCLREPTHPDTPPRAPLGVRLGRTARRTVFCFSPYFCVLAGPPWNCSLLESSEAASVGSTLESGIRNFVPRPLLRSSPAKNSLHFPLKKSKGFFGPFL